MDTDKQYPGAQWIPSNGTDGYSFLDTHCSQCAKDKAMCEGFPIEECDDNEVCKIIAASFVGKAIEWRELETGEIKCMAFVPTGESIPAPRCTHTAELF